MLCEPTVLGVGGTVPANVPALWWTPLGSEVRAYQTGQSVVVRRMGGPDVSITVEAPMAWPSTRMIRFGAPLEANTMYELVADTPCMTGGSAITARFQTGPSAPVPATIGTLVVGMPLRTWLTVDDGRSAGNCGPSFDAITHTVTVALSPEAAPWRNALHYEMTVDGTRWRWRTFRAANFGPTTGLPDLYLPCGAVDGGTLSAIRTLSPGMHTVGVTAFIPGSDTTFSLSTQVDLQCPGGPVDGGSAPGDTGPAPTDAPAPNDLGSAPPDVGSPVDAGSVPNDLGPASDGATVADTGTDAGSVPATDTGPPPAEGNGCSVQPGSGSPSGGLAAALGALGLAWTVRRRASGRSRRRGLAHSTGSSWKRTHRASA